MDTITAGIIAGVTSAAGSITSLVGDMTPIVIGAVVAVFVVTKGIGIFKRVTGKV